MSFAEYPHAARFETNDAPGRTEIGTASHPSLWKRSARPPRAPSRWRKAMW
ncbi:hypothetical protein ABC974_07940 [Sphingomonas oligophenolica]|uniref:Uncharacterized protein n=1 Tax=Sphingomonas oligophenolica TaxID=301154 RepID=A0ABU9Y161_9SPHN